MRRPLLTVGTLFLLGELAYRMLEEDIYFSALLILIGLIICYMSNKSMQKKCLGLLLFLCLVSGGVWAYGFYADKGSAELQNATNLNSEAEAVFYIESVEEKENSKKLVLNCDGERVIAYVKVGSNKKDDLLEVTQVIGLEPGRYMKARGIPEIIQGSTNPGGMDMEQYYAGKGIEYQIKISDYQMIEEKRNYLVNTLYHIRCWMAERLDEALSEEDSAVLKTMILGDKSRLDSETKVLYQRSGIVHILAISGLHVALLAGVLEWLLERFRIRKKQAVVVVIAFVFLYGLMTGFSEATMRAVIMLTISKLAFLFGRTPDLPTSMMEALLIMVIINPDSLFSTGMLMSYSAVLGVITGNMLSKYIVDRGSFKGLHKKLRGMMKKTLDGLLISLSINLWMLPLLMRSYYEVPVLSLLLNLIVIPLLTIVVASGIVVSLFGGMAVPAVWICHIFLLFYKKLCKVFIQIPGAIWSTGHIEVWQMGIMYFVMGGLLLIVYLILRNRRWWLEKKCGKKWRVVSLAIVFSLYTIISVVGLLGVRLWNLYGSRVVFLDVGQGDGSIIRYASQNYVVDCGSSSTDSVGQYTLIPALKYYAMTDIRCIYISHMDSDHMNGVLYLLENSDLYGIEVEHLAVAQGTVDNDNFVALKNAIKRGEEQSELVGNRGEKKTEIIELKKGDIVDGLFTVLYPSGDEPIEHEGNDYSLVLSFKTTKLEVLYTGDISSEVEKTIIKNGDNNILRVLKCPHHGSKYSSSEDFLKNCAPDITVISCGKNNMYGHPSPETLDRLHNAGTTIYRTDCSGAVIIDSP